MLGEILLYLMTLPIFLCGELANDKMLEILEKDYNPVNPRDLTPGEVFDKRLNDTTIMLIRKGMSDKKKRPYIHLSNAKEL